MSKFEQLSHQLSDRLDDIADGWQHLWQRARHAVTHFTPAKSAAEPDKDGFTDSDRIPVTYRPANANQWGLLSAEVIESDDEVEVQLEAPGMTRDDFQLRLEDNALLVSGHKQLQRSHREGRYHMTERAFGRFDRVIPLPCSVSAKRASASYRDGVLTITLPKQPDKDRRIKIDIA